MLPITVMYMYMYYTITIESVVTTAADTYHDQIHADAVLVQACQRVARLQRVRGDIQSAL